MLHRPLLILLLILLPVAACAPLRDSTGLGSRLGQIKANQNRIFAEQKTKLAVELIENGKQAVAKQFLQQAVEADFNYAPAHNNLGFLYFRRGQFQDAEHEFFGCGGT